MADMIFKTNIIPQSDNDYNLGSSTAGWKIERLNVKTGKNSTAFSTGSDGQILRTDGNNIYWGNTVDVDTWIPVSTSTAGYIRALSDDAGQYLSGKNTWVDIPVTSVAGKTNDVQLGDLTIGVKTYNGAENVIVSMADLGISSAMRFIGVTDTDITEGSTNSPVHIASGGTTGDITPVNGDVVLTQTNQIEYIYTGSEWKELGLASSYALAHHTHGNILSNGTITSDTTVASGDKLVTIDSSNKVSRSNISFGTDTTKALSNAGTWIDVNNYVLPTASASVKGGIKVGSGLTISNEVLAANVTGIKGNAETTYRTGNVNLTAANIGAAASNHNHDSTYVNVTGDTMTGNLRLKTSTLSSSAAPASNTNFNSIELLDSNSAMTGGVWSRYLTNGNLGMEVVAHRTIGSTNYWNGVQMYINPSATAVVTFNYPAAWRTGLGINWPGNTTTFLRGDGTWTDVTTGKFHIYNNADAQGSTASTNVPFLIGSPTSTHVVFDNNEIIAKNGATATTLYLSDTNGAVSVAGTGGLVVPNGRLSVGARTWWGTQAAGVVVQPDGGIHLGHASGGYIYFHHGAVTAVTAQIRETASATLRIGIRLAVNADSAIQYMNGTTGAFTLYVNGSIGANSGIWSSSDIVVRKNWTSTTAYSNCVSWYNESQNYGYIRLYRGTAATAGLADLVLGNNIASGTAKNSDGRIFLYNKAGACPMIWSDRTTLGGTARDAIRINYLQASQVWGAVWNDYAEFRQTNDENIKPGNCVIETGNGDLILSTERMQAGAEIVSDTYGMAIGETKINNTPIATAGRVLAYINESKDIIKQHIGEPVCSGPNGTVSLMTDEECQLFPYKMIGTISEIPDYEIWKAGTEEDPVNINVDGRVWIRIK